MSPVMQGLNRRNAIVLSCTSLCTIIQAKETTPEKKLQAPDFTLPYLQTNASPHHSVQCATDGCSLQAFRGRWVYLDFWASWCAPCQQSMPWMSQLQTQWTSKGLTVLAINLDNQRDKALQFLNRHPTSVTLLWDASGQTAKAFDIQAMPMSYLIDPQGRITAVHRGFTAATAQKIEREIRHALSSI